MKLIKFIIAGTIFGILVAKPETVSWYAVIGTVVIIGVIAAFIIKKLMPKDSEGNLIIFPEKSVKK